MDQPAPSPTPGIVGVPGEGTVPAFALGPAYPSPAREVAHWALKLPRAAHVRAEVVDLQGRRMAGVEAVDRERGVHTLRWNLRDDSGRAVPIGLYVLVVRVDGRTVTRPVTTLR